jgi:hypothetical protein
MQFSLIIYVINITIEQQYTNYTPATHVNMFLFWIWKRGSEPSYTAIAVCYFKPCIGSSAGFKNRTVTGQCTGNIS